MLKTFEKTRDSRKSEQAVTYSWGLIFLVIGLIVLAITSFSLLTQRFLYPLDLEIASIADENLKISPDWMVDLLRFLGVLGSQGTTVFAVALLIWFVWKKKRRELLLLLTSAIGGELIWLLLIFLFNRPRPIPVAAFGGGVDLPSYPSGHAELAVTIFGLLLYLYSSSINSSTWKLVLSLTVLLWAGMTGFIRLFLNVHYFSDVIAGYALGLAWLGFSILVVDRWILKSNKGSDPER
jgi:undecaprenyl-diphosphatase